MDELEDEPEIKSVTLDVCTIEWEIEFTKDGNVPSDIEGKDWADHAFLTRCANCGKQERWNV